MALELLAVAAAHHELGESRPWSHSKKSPQEKKPSSSCHGTCPAVVVHRVRSIDSALLAACPSCVVVEREDSIRKCGASLSCQGEYPTMK